MGNQTGHNKLLYGRMSNTWSQNHTLELVVVKGIQQTQGRSPRHALKLYSLAWGQLFHHICKHLQRRQKCCTAQRFFRRQDKQVSREPDRYTQQESNHLMYTHNVQGRKLGLGICTSNGSAASSGISITDAPCLSAMCESLRG